MLFVLKEIAGFDSRYFIFPSGARLADGVAAAALVFEGTAAGARSVASGWGGFRGGGGLRPVDDLGDAQVVVHFFEFGVDEGLGEGRRALGFDDFDDLHGGFEPNGGGGGFVAQQLSKSVDCQVGQVAEFVGEAVGALLTEGEEGAGEVGERSRPEVDGSAVEARLFGGGGDGLACDEALEDTDLNRRQGVEWCGLGGGRHGTFSNLMLLPRVVISW